MTSRRVFQATIILSIAVLSVLAFAGHGFKLKDRDVAKKLGISPAQVRGLHSQFALSNKDIVSLTDNQLGLILRDLAVPKSRRLASEVEFRALRMRDEHGNIPAGGLQRALEHRRHHGRSGHARDGEDSGADLFPTPPDPSSNVPSF